MYISFSLTLFYLLHLTIQFVCSLLCGQAWLSLLTYTFGFFVGDENTISMLIDIYESSGKEQGKKKKKLKWDSKEKRLTFANINFSTQQCDICECTLKYENLYTVVRWKIITWAALCYANERFFPSYNC